jgi:hypothetical protein
MLLSWLGINYQIPGRALIALDDFCSGGVAHALERASELRAVSPIVVLEANVEMPSSIKGAVDARFAGKRALYDVLGHLAFCHNYLSKSNEFPHLRKTKLRLSIQ